MIDDIRPAWTVSSHEVRFGRFALLALERELLKDGVPVRLGNRALDILILLVERAGMFVSNAEIFQRVWPTTVVVEGNLRVHVAGLRKALEDGQDGSRFIVNIPNRGYNFVAPIVRGAPALPRIEFEPLAATGVGRLHASRDLGLPGSTNGDGRPAPETGWREVQDPGRGAETNEPDRAADGVRLRALPSPLQRMVGRDDAVRAIEAELKEYRFVTVVGPGGIGKTTVVVCVANLVAASFGNEVHFIDLASVTDPALVPSTLAAQLGLEVRHGDSPSSIVSFLRDKRVLLVLDCCEHLIDAVAPLAERIFGEVEEVHLLATSREALRVEGERVHRLVPLEVPPDDDALTAEQALGYSAVQLFAERAAARDAQFVLQDEDAPIVAKICRSLDGIALAVELAAGRVEAYGTRGIAFLLDTHLRFLCDGRRTALPRHQTMTAALEWSYALLPDIERRVLLDLSVFVGTFSLEAARSVIDSSGLDDLDVAEAIAKLVARSMLASDSRGAVMRYRLFNVTRVFAAEKRALLPDGESLLRRHAAFFAATQAQEEDLGNLRAALQWAWAARGDMALGGSLAASVAPLLMELSLLTECRVWSERALATLPPDQLGTLRELELQSTLGHSLMFTTGNGEGVRESFQRALQVAEVLQDTRSGLRLLGALAIYLQRTSDFHGALDVALRAEATAVKTGDPLVIASAQSRLGVSLYLRGEIVAAQRNWDLALASRVGSDRKQAVQMGFDHRIRALCGRAQCLWLRGQCDLAAEVAAYSIEQAQALDHPATLCIAYIVAGAVFTWRGDWTRAQDHVDRLKAYATRHSLLPYLAVARGLAGELDVKRGLHEKGVAELYESMKFMQANRYSILMTVFYTALAEGLNGMGQRDDAGHAIDEALKRIERDGDYCNKVDALRVKGEILDARSTPDPSGAESCLLAALAQADRQSTPSLKLRAANSLAKAWIAQGRRTEAGGLLLPIFGAFSEGRASHDHVVSRRLLDALG